MSSLVLEIEIPEGEPEPGDDWRVTQAKTLIRHDSVRKAVLAAVREKIGDAQQSRAPKDLREFLL